MASKHSAVFKTLELVEYLKNVFTQLIQEKKRKQAETDRKRAEVRARLEEASKAKKAKKGFMTPDRKKKLRVSIYCIS